MGYLSSRCLNRTIYLLLLGVVLTLFNKTPSPCKQQDEVRPLEESNFTSRRLFDYMSYHVRKKPYPGVSLYTSFTVARLKLRPLDIKPIIPDYTPVFNDVQSFIYNFNLPPCARSTRDVKTIFVAVISAPSNFEKRKAIRETWRRNLTSKLFVLNFAFVIGKSFEKDAALAAENATYGDILQIEMVDTYYNITIKVTALLNWLNVNCKDVDFVLKVDDDVYVNVNNLANIIEQLDPKDLYVYGEEADGKVGRDGKWKLTYREYPWNTFPKYLQGAAVLLSGKTIRYLLAAAQTIPYHKIDDLYLTGFSAEKAGIGLMTFYGFFERFYDVVPSECDVMYTVTWLVDSAKTLKLSHSVAEELYNNKTKCLMRHSNNPTASLKPIRFKRIKS